MKRILAIVLMLAVVTGLAACKRDKDSTADPTVQGGSSSQSTDSTAGADNSGVERSIVQVLSGVAAANADGSKSYEYKWETLEKRLLMNMTAAAGDSEVKLSFTYRESVRTGTVTGLASGVTIDFAWDEAGRFISMTETSTGGTYSVAYVYDDDGRCTEKSISRNGENVSKVTSTYEGGKLVKEITSLPDGSVSNRKECVYNEKGDLEQEITQWTGASAVVKEYTYTYDDSDRPLTCVAADGNGVQTAKHVYTYDTEGRVLSDTSFEGDIRTAHEEYTYDDDGNLTSKQMFVTGQDSSSTVDYTYTEARMSDEEYALYQALLEASQSWC